MFQTQFPDVSIEATVIGVVLLWIFVPQIFSRLASAVPRLRKYSLSELEKIEQFHAYEYGRGKAGSDAELTPGQKRLIAAETQAWQTHSTEPLEGVANETYIQQVGVQLAQLERNGIDRDFSFTPHPTKNAYFGDIDYASDGKIKRGLTSAIGRVEYTWRERGTGRKLGSKTLRQAELQFSLASGLRSADGTEWTCMNCGMPIEVSNDDIVRCPACASIMERQDYRRLLTHSNVYPITLLTEAKRGFHRGVVKVTGVLMAASGSLWLLAHVLYRFIPESALQSVAAWAVNVIQQILYAFFIALDALGSVLMRLLTPVVNAMEPVIIQIFDSFTTPTDLSPRRVAWFIIILALIGLGLFIRTFLPGGANYHRRKKNTGLAIVSREQRDIDKHIKEDPLFSEELVVSEMVMMMKACWLTPPEIGRTVWGIYTTPENREQLQKLRKRDGNVVDLLINEALFYKVESDLSRQQIRCYLDYEAARYERGTVKLSPRKVAVTLVRNTTGRTIAEEGYSSCVNCGNHVDTLTNDSCTACGTPLHRDEVHWRLGRIEPARERPARRFTRQTMVA